MPATDGRNLQPRCGCSACSGAELGALRRDVLGPTETWTVEQLMDQMISGWSWPGAGSGPVQVTYSFPSSAAGYGTDYPQGSQSELGGFSPFTEAQRALAVEALALWADVANVQFVEVSGNADIRFGNTTTASSSPTPTSRRTAMAATCGSIRPVPATSSSASASMAG